MSAAQRTLTVMCDWPLLSLEVLLWLAADDNTLRFCGMAALYYGHFWRTVWQLPLVGCRRACRGLKDSVKEVPMGSFVVHKAGMAANSALSGVGDVNVWDFLLSAVTYCWPDWRADQHDH